MVGGVPAAKLVVHDLRLAGGHLALDVEPRVPPTTLRRVRLVARSRGGRPELVLATTDAALQQARVRLDADLAPLLDGPADEIVDLVVEVERSDGTTTRRPLPMPGWRARRRVRDGRVQGEGTTTLVLPYFSAGARPQLVLRLESRSTPDQQHLDRLLRLAPLLWPVRLLRGCWLVGEQPHKAQDNGYHLFRWLRTQHPRRRAFYVIAADSPDRARLEGLGNVVTHGSRQHMWLSLTASRFLGTHHAEYLLASRSRRLRRHARGVRIALRHGVFAMKDMSALYARPSRDYRTDDIIVSSPLEGAIVRQDLGYRAAQVHVTGMPRIDRLLTDVPTPERTVLVMPTWRPWLQHDGSLEGSDFLARWTALLTDPVLQTVARERGVRLQLLLHPNLRRQAGLVDLPGVETINPADADVQDLLRRCGMLVTDYSSVALDAALLDRPVVFYQFDRERLSPRPFVADELLPGPVCHGHDVVRDAVVGRIDDDLRPGPGATARARTFFTHDDGRNAERVVALAARRRAPWFALVRASRGLVARRLWERWRAHRTYRPTMRALYAVGRLLPRSDATVFETDTGHGFGDAPRALHAEMSRRGSPGRLVWSVRTGRRLPDPSIERVVRGSPRWFWELARARAWIVNQNLPHDLRRPRGTTYVQTWHGTPLKRMQHDAHAQDPAYLERVSAATRQWSVLLSPSPYATAAFRSAFRYDGPVLEEGSPRNDALVLGRRDGRVRATLRDRWGLADGPAVLYAPTFRDGRTRDPLPLDVAALVALLPPEWSVLVRPHPLVRSPRVPGDVAARVRDVRDHPDAQELLLAADVLVTDYSSLLFDATVAEVPVVLHVPDLERYRDDERGFYLDLEDPADRPGPLTRTVEETAAAVVAAHRAPGTDSLRRFRERFGPLDDGAASRRVVDALQDPATWSGA